jgi:Fe-S-cluster containining protein
VEQQGRLEEVQRRADQRRARGKGACPLLSRNGRCSVYEERPLSCRLYNSADREACRSAVRDPYNLIVPMSAFLLAAGVALRHLIQPEKREATCLNEALPAVLAARIRQIRKREKKGRRPKPANERLAATWLPDPAEMLGPGASPK